MSSSRTFATLAASSTADPTSDPDHKGRKAIIGITLGMVALVVLMFVPCFCFQWISHRKQKKEERREATERARRAGGLNVNDGPGIDLGRVERADHASSDSGNSSRTVRALYPGTAIQIGHIKDARHDERAGRATEPV
ncbi:hypothetical protein F53441_5575 [Fusarium austroafricanum]|uniref:Uncharacterized protein n=1 Tax=Fusarium austroafricanum TaxID=2364996 RepID=A0A8H4KLM9_9HYPO|nr:hypothetical protein F53441_5575 [Fusarium austroafricanum]